MPQHSFFSASLEV